MLFKQDDAGQGVLLIQDRLRELGLLDQGESRFGPATAQAVRRFQQTRGLAADAVVGPKTWARLFPPLKPTREYLDRVLYEGRPVFDGLDEVVAAVAEGEWGAFDALQLNRDGEGLSYGILQWAQGPGSLYTLLAACQAAAADIFVKIFGEGNDVLAADLLAKTRGGGKKLALWRGEWPLRFWLAGRDLTLQRVQRTLARQQLSASLEAGCRLYPEGFKPGGAVALRALVMMADVANQAGPGGLRQALKYARRRTIAGEAAFIRALGEYVENLIASEYGDPDYGNTRGRHEAICRRYPLDRVDWAVLRPE